MLQDVQQYIWLDLIYNNVWIFIYLNRNKTLMFQHLALPKNKKRCDQRTCYIQCMLLTVMNPQFENFFSIFLLYIFILRCYHFHFFAPEQLLPVFELVPCCSWFASVYFFRLFQSCYFCYYVWQGAPICCFFILRIQLFPWISVTIIVAICRHKHIR